MEPWYIWIIAALIFFIIEVFTTGFVLACFGVGCILSGLISLFFAGITIQAVTFAIISFVAFLTIRPIVVKRFYRTSDKIKTNVDALSGREGIVSEKIDPAQNQGRVIIDGEDWRGISIDDAVIEKGEKITVVKVDGTRVLVQKSSIKRSNVV